MDNELEMQTEEDRRIRLLDAMATMADRANRPDTFRFHIEEVRKILLPRLEEGSPQAFEVIGEGLFTCGIQLPFKAPMYATLTGLLTSSSEPYCKTMAKRLTEALVKQLSGSLRDGQSSIARRTLRYLGCLACASVVNPTSVAEYVHVILDAAHFELTTAKRSEFGVHCRGEFLADIGLSLLPWCGKLFTDRVPAEMEKIVALVEQIAAAWKPNIWRCVAPAIDRRCAETFSQTLDAICELRDADWICDHEIIPKPYPIFEVELSGGHELTLQPLSIPGHSKVTFYSAPRFRVVLVGSRTERKDSSAPLDVVKEEDEKVEVTEDNPNEKDKTAAAATNSNSSVAADGMEISTPSASTNNTASGNEMPVSAGKAGMTATGATANDARNDSKPEPSSKGRKSIVTFIIRTYVGDVVDNFSSRHLMAAERLLNMPMLKDVNDEIVEGLFSQMCAMPSPTNSLVYYGTLFTDLCRVKDSRLPSKLLVAVKTMFQHADEFDPEAFDRLTDWFSFHLSNFGYKWNWQEWAIYADADMVDRFPYRALFCKDVIARCVRLSYFDRVKSILPEEMKVFLPVEPNNGNRSRFDDTMNAELMRIVTGKGRLPWLEVQERLKEMIPEGAEPKEEATMATENGEDENEDKMDAAAKANLERLIALVRAILLAGCRTLSHFDIVVERYMELLRQMSTAGGDRAKRLITSEVNTFWGEVHIRRLYVLDKLAQYGVIDYMGILDSCLCTVRAGPGVLIEKLTDRELMLRLSQSSWWEMIRLVMARARAREEGSRKELRLASHGAATANEGEQEEAGKRLEKAMLSTEEAKREIRDLLLEGLKRLFALCGRLLDVVDVDMDEDGGEGMRLPGFSGKPLWFWRCLGMIRELTRMHGQHVGQIIEELDSYTKELREKHATLWEAFDIIREVDKCSLLPIVW